MKMAAPKPLQITQEMIELFARGCPLNNPVVIALKETGFPGASEIIVESDQILVDGIYLIPTIQLTRWINDWNHGRKVRPSILGYRML